MFSMIFNAFISNESLNGIDASIYSIVGMDENITNNQRFATAWRLSRAYKKNQAVPFHDGHEIFVIGQGPEEVVYQNTKAIKKESITVDTNQPDHRAALASVLNEQLKAKMARKGYTHETRKFFPKNPSIEQLDNGEPIQLYRDGCQYEAEVLQSGHYLVWIDPKSRIKQSALDFIRWKLQGSSQASLEKELIGTRVNMAPFGMSGRLESIEWEHTPATYSFPAPVNILNKTGAPEVTLQDYWKFTHRVQIRADDAPLIMVKLKSNDRTVPYPPSTVYLPTKHKSFPKQIRTSFIMPSPQRMRKTETMAADMLDGIFSIGAHSVSFSSSMVTDQSLLSHRKVLRTGTLPDPTFFMGNTRRAKDPRDLQKFGPFSKPRHIPLFYLIPEEYKLNVNTFHDQLQVSMDSLKLGTIHLMGLYRVQFSGSQPTRNDYWDAALDVCRQMKKQDTLESPDGIEVGKPIILSILPGKDSEAYTGGKQAAHAEDQVIQDVTIQTARHIADGNTFMGKNTVIQLYLKCLKRGEAPWILEHPAGRARGTAYLGYDVSRRFEAEGAVRKEAAATISMVDGLGRHILNKIHTTQTGEKLDANTANRIIFDVSREAKDTFEDFGETFGRLVIFKDGIMHGGEVENIRKGALSAVESMLPKSSMPDEITVDLVSVVKSSIERLYKDDGGNVDDGIFVVFSDGSGVVVNSHLGRKGARVTAQPTRLEPKFRITQEGDVKIPKMLINQLVHEFCDLCYLDWASIFHQPKYPIVLRLVQSLGEQYTLDISDPTYLPL